MKTYFKQYRPFFVFLIKFFSVYVGLTLLYQFYLNQFDNLILFQVDDFTQLVARQVQKTLLFFNYDSSLELHDNQASVKLFLNQVYVARVVEGCNALSVMILFTAFIVAFSGRWMHTALFVVAGCILIHVLNVLRIALLCLALLHYPEQEHLLHGVVFPLFIYGVVFGLWVIWVNKFSLHAEKNAK
ncbi:exosortase family protein XrtF [Flavobacterium psychrotolerans]|uniref:Exosortase family protein XrtF n=1 Tax=Flavobacterium psychrotolerans TaxID=2169410 RepID=A0A2U1JNS0_9FLAO|nr:exosortase family protein XrtF [Flavobacterium psychrotolerans]PWA06609.1 exosortase family protein XrtF [Flavobacterium psychrotolerans]